MEERRLAQDRVRTVRHDRPVLARHAPVRLQPPERRLLKPSSSPSSSTRTVASPVKTTSTGKQTTGKANIVDANYRPRFNGGYVPPVGSQVQYVQSSASLSIISHGCIFFRRITEITSIDKKRSLQNQMAPKNLSLWKKMVLMVS